MRDLRSILHGVTPEQRAIVEAESQHAALTRAYREYAVSNGGRSSKRITYRTLLEQGAIGCPHSLDSRSESVRDIQVEHPMRSGKLWQPFDWIVMSHCPTGRLKGVDITLDRIDPRWREENAWRKNRFSPCHMVIPSSCGGPISLRPTRPEPAASLPYKRSISRCFWRSWVRACRFCQLILTGAALLLKRMMTVLFRSRSLCATTCSPGKRRWWPGWLPVH